MTTTYTIKLVVQGDDKASAPLGNVTNSLSGMQTVMGGILGAQMLTRVGQGVFDIGKKALDAYVGYEKLTLSLQSLAAREILNTGVTGSMSEALALASDKSQELYDWTLKVGILSPFSQQDIADGLKMAMTYGFTADQSMRLTQTLTDFSTATGASGEVIDRVVRSLGQMNAQGKVTGMEVRELANAGIPLKSILADAFGVTTAEITNMIADGLIPADAAVEILSDKLENDFGGAAARSTETMGGLINSLQDLTDLRLREYFTTTFEAIQPYLADFSEALQDPENIAKIQEMGEALGTFIVDTIEGIKDLIGWWQDLSVPQQDFIVFLGGVVLMGPTVVSVITGISTAAMGLPAVLTAIQTGWAAWNAGLSITTALGAAGIAPIAIAVGAIAVMVASVAAMWYTWNTQITKTVETGREGVAGKWDEFFESQVASGDDAIQTLAAYNEKQAAVKRVLEETNPVIRLMMGDTEMLTQDNEGLAEALALTADNYGQYKDAVYEAGIQNMLLTESQWAEIQAQAALESQAQDTTGAIDEQSAAFSDLTPEMILANMEAEKAKIAQEELAKAQEEAAEKSRDMAKAYGDLAMQLMNASAAEIAKASISDLGKALDEGLITPQMYGDAIRSVGSAFGLVNDKSLILAESLPRLTGYFSSGVIPAKNLDDALKMLNDQAATGVVDFDAIIAKYGELPEGLGEMESGVSAGATAITEATLKAAEESVAAIDGVGWYELGTTVTGGVAEGADSQADTITAVMTEAKNASWSVFEKADWFGLGKILGEAIAKGILAAKPTIISAAIEVAMAALAAGKGVVPQPESFTGTGGFGLSAFATQTPAPISLSTPVSTQMRQVHFHGPVTFEIKERATLDDIVRELSNS